MPLERAEISAFEHVLRIADENGALVSGNDGSSGPNSPSPALAASLLSRHSGRPDFKSRKRKELRIKASNAALKSVLAPDSNGLEGYFFVELGVRLTEPTALAPGSLDLKLSLLFERTADPDLLPDTLAVPFWCFDFAQLSSSDKLDVVPATEPMVCSRVQLRPILPNLLNPEAPWVPTSEAAKNLEGKSRDRAIKCLDNLNRQFTNRTFLAAKEPSTLPIWAGRVSGSVVMFAVCSVSSEGDGTLLRISDDTDLEFLPAVYLDNLSRITDDMINLLEARVPCSAAAEELVFTAQDALTNSRLFSALNLAPPRGICVTGPSGSGKKTAVRYLRRKLGLGCIAVRLLPVLARFEEAEEDDDHADGDALIEAFAKVQGIGPSFILIPDLDSLVGKGSATARAKLVSELRDAVAKLPPGVLVIGLSTQPIQSLKDIFTLEIAIEPPNALERERIIASLLQPLDPLATQRAKEIAKSTPGKTPAELEAIVRAAAWTSSGSFDVAKLDVPTPAEQLHLETDWDAFGGYTELVTRLRKLVSMSLLNPETFERLGVRPARGLLLTGPSGCGKTMLARLLASEAGLNSLALESSRAFSKYLGDSEAYIRETFARARKLAPCVVLVDPLDTLATNRGTESGGNGVSERVLSTLLNELDGIEERTGVFVIGCTDRIRDVDEALLRPGRFDRVVDVPLPAASDRSAIIDTLKRKTPIEEAVQEWIVEKTEGWTGGDLAGLVREAAMVALARSRDSMEVSKANFEVAFGRVRAAKGRW